MIQIGVLKNFDSGTYKAGVQLAGSLTTYFDDISVAKNIPSSALVIGNYVIVAIPGGNPRDACVIATWPQGSPGANKLNDIGDVSVASPTAGDFFYYHGATKLWKSKAHAALTTGVHGAGSDYLVNTAMRKVDMTPIAGYILRQMNFTANTPFSASINGALTSTSVPYDTDTNEGSLIGINAGPTYWGRIILHNTTRGNSRKIVSVDITTNTITTEDTSDDWADNDVITTQSQTNTQAGYVDIDLSNEVPATAYAAWLFATHADNSGIADPNRYVIFHPYVAYDLGLRIWFYSDLANDKPTFFFGMKIVDQKITYIVNSITNSSVAIFCTGIMKTPA